MEGAKRGVRANGFTGRCQLQVHKKGLRFQTRGLFVPRRNPGRDARRVSNGTIESEVTLNCCACGEPSRTIPANRRPEASTWSAPP